MTITNILIMHLPIGADHVSLDTDLPSAVYPFSGIQSLELRVAKGKGREYVARIKHQRKTLKKKIQEIEDQLQEMNQLKADLKRPETTGD